MFSVLSAVSLTLRIAFVGATVSILRWLVSAKLTVTSAGASPSRTIRSRWARYMRKSGRPRTSLKPRAKSRRSPSSQCSSQLLGLGFTAERLGTSRVMIHSGSESRGEAGMRIQVAGALSPRAPPVCTKVT